MRPASESPTLGNSSRLAEPVRRKRPAANDVAKDVADRRPEPGIRATAVCYNQLPSVAYGGALSEAGLDGHIIQPKKLRDIAVKVVSAKK